MVFGVESGEDTRVVQWAYKPFALDKQPPRRLRLAGLDPSAVYAGSDGSWHGATLMHHGLTLSTWFHSGAGYRTEMVVLRRV